jgi:hypothetical protein
LMIELMGVSYDAVQKAATEIKETNKREAVLVTEHEPSLTKLGPVNTKSMIFR